MCRLTPAAARAVGFFDHEYFDESHPCRSARHIAEAPVLPGSGMFMPGGTGAWKDKGLFRRERAGFQSGPLHRLHGMRASLSRRCDSQHGA